MLKNIDNSKFRRIRNGNKRLYDLSYVNAKELIENLEDINILGFEVESNAKYYKMEKLKGRVGTIAPISDCFCKNCNKMMITHDGFIRLCLHADEEIDLREFLHKPIMFKEVIKEILKEKPRNHTLIWYLLSNSYIINEKIKYKKEKDFTDTEIAFNLAVEKGAKEIVLLGGTGTRYDHSLSNLGLMLKALKMSIILKIIDDNNIIFLTDKSMILKGNKGDTISFHAYCECVKNLNICGSKYDLIN